MFYNIKYKNDIIHHHLTIEEAADYLQDYADRFFSTKDEEDASTFNPQDLKLEEIINGSEN